MVETISNFFSYIVTLIENIVGFFINTVSGIISFVTSLPMVIGSITAVTSYLPSIFSLCITVTISILIIKFVIGRQ